MIIPAQLQSGKKEQQTIKYHVEKDPVRKIWERELAVKNVIADGGNLVVTGTKASYPPNYDSVSSMQFTLN